MPNWCNNHIRISHSDKSKIDAIMATEGTEKGILNTIIPCPEELNITAGFLGDAEQQRELERKEQENIAKYGFKNWYDWNIAHWGTKWDLCEPSLIRVNDNTVEIACDTAWSPPIAAYETMSEAGYEVTAYYYEPGMCYAGRWTSEDGDECYHDWGDSEGARATLPEEIDEMFGISESQAEYEEEERREEELYRWTVEGAEANERTKKLIKNIEDFEG